jgi:Zn-dependent protease with chaperone function
MTRNAVLALALSAMLLSTACQFDSTRAMSAASDAYMAETLSNDDIRALGMQAAAKSDSENKVAAKNSLYTRRLEALTGKFQSAPGAPSLNFKVYMVDELNAFALPDGSIRVYSGLMDKMEDDELLFVVGHEIGHAAMGHSKNRFKNAYRVSAVRKAAGAAHASAATLTDSQLGDLLEAYVNAQFSQSQEYEADKYGANLLKKNGKSPKIGANALRKLGSGGGGALSSHPDTANRVKRVEAMI